MADIGALYVRILADMKTFGADLKSKMSKAEGDAEGSGKKVGGGFGKGLATAATAFAGLAVVDYMKNAGEAASELNVDIGRTKDVFEAASPSVLTWSKNAAQGLGLSQDQALTLANKLGTMYESMGMSSKGAAKLSESAIKLGTDLGTFYKKDPSTAINSIRMATLGAYRGMRQFGVSIDKDAVTAQALSMHLGTTTVNQTKLAAASKAVSSAELKALTTRNASKAALLVYNEAVVKHGRGSDQAQKALLKLNTAQAKERATAIAVAAAHAKVSAVLKSGKTTLTQAEKAQATYALITQKTSKAQNAFAKDSNALDVQNRKTRAEFKNMQAQLGTALLPVMTKVGGIIATQVAPALAKLAGFVAKNRSTLVPLLGALTAFVVAVKAAKVVQNFGKDISAVSKGLKEMQLGQKLATAWTKLQAAAQWLLNAAMDANPIALIVIAIVALIAILVLAYVKVGWFRAAVQAAFAAVSAAAQWVWQKVVVAFHWIVNAIGGVINWLKLNWPLVVGILLGPIGIVLGIFIRWRTQITGMVVGAFTAILNVIRNLFGQVVSFVSGAVSRIVGFFAGLPGALTRFGSGMIQGFLNGITGAWSTVTSWVGGIGKKILLTIGNAELWLVNIGVQVIQGLVNGLANGWHLVTDKLSSLASTLTGPFKKVLGILSPSKVMAREIGVPITQGIAVGITQAAGDVHHALASLPMHPAIPATVYGAAYGAMAGTTAGAARGAPVVGNMYVQALDAGHLANTVADRIAYQQLRTR